MQSFGFLHISLLPRSGYRLRVCTSKKTCDIIIVCNIPGDVIVINDFSSLKLFGSLSVLAAPITGGSGASVTFSVSTDSDELTTPVAGSVCVTTMVMKIVLIGVFKIRLIVHVNVSVSTSIKKY